MKAVFSTCLGVLLAASVVTTLTLPERKSGVPVLYWVTDPNPARVEQVELFHAWLERNGHPRFELRLDSANRGQSKQIIQGVSGVAADIMDCQMHALQEIGMLKDVTEEARQLGFDLSRTYPALDSEITLDGRQYVFPCNVNVMGYWVNLATFEKAGIPPPPRTWDFETFERVGKAFVAAANPPRGRQKAFFADSAMSWGHLITVMHRSLGLSVFNETCTRCTLDDPRYARVLGLLFKWTHVDRILPGPADEASFSTEVGYGGAKLQLFNSGNYAMISIGRWCLIQTREFAPIPLSVSHYPYEEFPNAVIGTRPAGVYAGGKHTDLAVYFLAFLASREYNEHIVRDADALPPNPIYTRSDEYLRPAAFPNEWGCHEVPVEAAASIAIGRSHSPFVPINTVGRYQRQVIEKIMAGLVPPEGAAREVARRLNEEIERTVAENPELAALFTELSRTQRDIEARRAAGGSVPLSWLRNPFHRRFYVAQKWAQGEG